MRLGAIQMPDLNRVYWDSCAWLGLINAEPAKIAPLQHLYNQAQAGLIEIWTSAVAYVEVFRLASEGNSPPPLDDENLDRIKDVIEQPFIKLIPVDMEIGRKARGLRRSLVGFKGAGDAIHLASALVWNISPLHTWDGSHLLPFDGQLSCKNAVTLEICIPKMPALGPLFRDEG